MDKFVPDVYQKSIYTIDYEKLKNSGIKCLLIDLDNTIAPLSIKKPDTKAKNLFAELQDMGFKVIIVSNSGKTRVSPFKDYLNVDAAHTAMKPFKKKYNKIMKVYGFKDVEIAAIGDQLCTDILGANRMGITSILINPISSLDFFGTKFFRFIEKKIFARLYKKGILEKGVYYD